MCSVCWVATCCATKKKTDRSRCLSVPRVSFAGNDSSHRHDWHSVFPPNGHGGSRAILLQTVSLTFSSHLRRVWQAASHWIFLCISVKAQRWLECVLCSTQQHLGRAGQGIISSFKRVWLRVTAVILIASTQLMCKLLKQRRPEGPLYILKDGSSLSLSSFTKCILFKSCNLHCHLPWRCCVILSSWCCACNKSGRHSTDSLRVVRPLNK